MSKTTKTNPTEGVSTQTSGTDKSTEQILNDLHKVKREWRLDLGDFISFVSNKNKDDEGYEWELFVYLSNQTDVVKEEGYVLDELDSIELWTKVWRESKYKELEEERQNVQIELWNKFFRKRIYKVLEEEQRIVLDYLDGEVV